MMKNAKNDVKNDDKKSENDDENCENGCCAKNCPGEGGLRQQGSKRR